MKDWTCVAPTGAKQTRFQEVPKYEEGLYDLKKDAYAWMVPNGSWGESNAGLICGAGESLLVDTLWDVPKTKTMLDTMEPFLEGRALKTVVNTHSDGDHFWGNELVKDLEIITSIKSYEEMKTQKPRSMLLLQKIGRFLSVVPLVGNSRVGHWFQSMSKPYEFDSVTPTLPSCTFEDFLQVEVGGREVHLIEVGPAHTDGDLLVYVPDAKLLYTGDILFIGSTPVMWAGPVSNWVRACDTILDMDVETIVPGHGPITDKEGVKLVRDYWVFLDQQIKDKYDQGKTAQQAAEEVVLSDEFQEMPHASWNSPERMMVSAHTLFRHYQGRTDSPGIPELLRTLYRQAELAHKLPNAQPACMRFQP